MLMPVYCFFLCTQKRQESIGIHRFMEIESLNIISSDVSNRFILLNGFNTFCTDLLTILLADENNGIDEVSVFHRCRGFHDQLSCQFDDAERVFQKHVNGRIPCTKIIQSHIDTEFPASYHEMFELIGLSGIGTFRQFGNQMVFMDGGYGKKLFHIGNQIIMNQLMIGYIKGKKQIRAGKGYLLK